MLVEKILEMENSEIIEMLSIEEYNKAIEYFKSINSFCDRYQYVSTLSGDDEFFTPSEYLRMVIENNAMHLIDQDILNF